MYEKGHAPIEGGVLAQDRWFTGAYLFVTNEWKRLEAEALKVK